MKPKTTHKAQIVSTHNLTQEAQAVAKAAQAVIATLTTEELDSLQQALDRGDQLLYHAITTHLYEVAPHLFAVCMPIPGEEELV